MTGKYWLKIALGMLLVFAGGMFVGRVVEKGRNLVETVTSLPLLSNGFRVDGMRLGDVQRIQLLRASGQQVDSAIATVKLTQPGTVGWFNDCNLMVTNGRHFTRRTGLTCVTTAALAQQDVVPFGHVVVEPNGKTLALYIPRSALDEYRQKAYTGLGSSDSGDVDIQTTDGKISITVNGREIINAHGDSTGGSLVIRDAQGNPIVQISGDSNGGRLVVKDASGNTKVNINATDKGKPKP